MRGLKIDGELLKAKMFSAEQKMLLAMVMQHEELMSKLLGTSLRHPFSCTAKEISIQLGITYKEAKALFTTLSEQEWIETKTIPNYWARETRLTHKFYSSIGRV